MDLLLSFLNSPLRERERDNLKERVSRTGTRDLDSAVQKMVSRRKAAREARKKAHAASAQVSRIRLLFLLLDFQIQGNVFPVVKAGHRVRR